jgi:hypothetical protein
MASERKLGPIDTERSQVWNIILKALGRYTLQPLSLHLLLLFAPWHRGSDLPAANEKSQKAERGQMMARLRRPKTKKKNKHLTGGALKAGSRKRKRTMLWQQSHEK